MCLRTFFPVPAPWGKCPCEKTAGKSLVNVPGNVPAVANVLICSSYVNAELREKTSGRFVSKKRLCTDRAFLLLLALPGTGSARWRVSASRWPGRERLWPGDHEQRASIWTKAQILNLNNLKPNEFYCQTLTRILFSFCNYSNELLSLSTRVSWRFNNWRCVTDL